jgi:hypothetical protein
MTRLDLREHFGRQTCPVEAGWVALLSKRGPFPMGRYS